MHRIYETFLTFSWRLTLIYAFCQNMEENDPIMHFRDQYGACSFQMGPITTPNMRTIKKTFDRNHDILILIINVEVK